MKLSIQLHAAGLSLSDTVSVLENFGVRRARSTVHNWMRKAELEPEPGKSPDYVAIDESVIKLNDQRFWLYVSVDPATNGFLHVRVFQGRTQAYTEGFVSELLEKYELEETLFLVDGTPWFHAALHRFGCDYDWVTNGRRNAVERIFKEVKRITYQFANHFRNASVESAKTGSRRSPLPGISQSEHCLAEANAKLPLEA